MYHNIMVPIDGSALAELAVPTAADLAHRSDAVLHIVEVTGWLDELGRSTAGASADADVHALAAEIAEQYGTTVVANTLFDEVTGVDYVSPPVSIVTRMLAQHIHERGIELCVMSTHGRGGISRVLSGSVADGILRHARIPCLFLKQGSVHAARRPALRAGRVLVAVQFDDHIDQLIANARALGDPYGALYTLIHAQSPSLLPISFGASEIMADAEYVREAASDRLQHVAALLSRDGRPARTELAISPFAASTLVEYAERHGFDAIVMNTRGRSPVGRAVLGSVADAVLRHVSIPVLMCPTRHAPHDTWKGKARAE